MKKLISFKQLKNNCAWRYVTVTGDYYCNSKTNPYQCLQKNCPVWKRLETLPDKYIDGKPYWNIGGFREDRK